MKGVQPRQEKLLKLDLFVHSPLDCAWKRGAARTLTLPYANHAGLFPNHRKLFPPAPSENQPGRTAQGGPLEPMPQGRPLLHRLERGARDHAVAHLEDGRPARVLSASANSLTATRGRVATTRSRPSSLTARPPERRSAPSAHSASTVVFRCTVTFARSRRPATYCHRGRIPSSLDSSPPGSTRTTSTSRAASACAAPTPSMPPPITRARRAPDSGRRSI